jgi:hypothetical protein
MTATQYTAEVIVRIRQARAWRPGPGQSLTGTIVLIQKRTGDYGTYPVVIMEPEAGDLPADLPEGAYVAFHAFHELALDQLREIKAGKGLRVTIAYGGKLSTNKTAALADSDPNKRRYHQYTIVPADGGILADEIADLGAFDATEDPGF